MPVIRRTTGKGLDGLIQYVQDMENEKVLVGVTKSTNGGRNAVIAMTHEFGSPVKNIPERSFLRSTLLENGDEYARLLANEIPNAIQSGVLSSAEAYGRLGLKVSNDVKLKLASGDFAPLSQRTIDRKGSSKPLIDTGELRQSITWELKE